VSFPAGGSTGPPLEGAASAALAAVRQRMGPGRPFPAPEPRKLTDEERAQAMAAIAQGQGCPCCGGIHVQEDFGCPRLAWFRRDADGRLTEGVYWADGSWDTRRITFADPAEETGTDGGN
jgi:hypothetical protein